MKKTVVFFIVSIAVLLMFLFTLSFIEPLEKSPTGKLVDAQKQKERVEVSVKKNFLNSVLLLSNFVIISVIVLFIKKQRSPSFAPEDAPLSSKQLSKLDILLNHVTEMRAAGLASEDITRELRRYSIAPVVKELLVSEEAALRNLGVYVAHQRAEGRSDEFLQKTLREKNWQEDVIRVACE